jgi:hypothetical protein
MDADLQPIHTQVMQAAAPEDLFGSEDVVLPVERLLTYLEGKYSPLKSVTSQAYQDPEDLEASRDADAKLEKLYALAQERIRNHVYGIEGRGRPRPAYAKKSFDVGPNRYFLGNKVWDGDHVSLYEAYMEREGVSVGEVVVKVARDPSHNHIVDAEVRNLDILHGKPEVQWKHLPFIMDRFQSGRRQGIVQRKISGHPLSEIRRHRAHKNGLDRKHMVWIMDRCLSCLGYVHRQGVVHGALDPERIIVQALSHNALIVGWSAAVHEPAKSGKRTSVPPGDFTAPEVRERGHIGPWSDIYSLGKLMIWLLGGDIATNQIPEGIEEPWEPFLQSLVTEDYLKRPTDAWEVYDQECAIKKKLWPRTYLHLDMS